jgi:hypothetical protein
VAARGGAVDVVNLGDVDHIGAAIAGCRGAQVQDL